MTKIYPVILTPTESGYVASVPDIEIDTQGTNIHEAIFMVRDAIGLWGISTQDHGRAIPEPSTTEPAHESGDLVAWVDIDFEKYRIINDMSTVRMNISLPRYLKAAGDDAKINFSHELQERLKERLHIR